MLVGLYSDYNAGGHFLNWSLHFLAGHINYFLAKENKLVELTDNPLTNINAHNFVSNTTIKADEFAELFSKLQHYNSTTFKIWHLQKFKSITFTTNPICELTKNAITEIQKVSAKNIFLQMPDAFVLYNLKYESRALTTKFNSFEYYKNQDEQHEDFINTFFSESKKVWDELNLNNIWDKREFLALNIRPFHSMGLLPNIDLQIDHFRLSASEMYNCFDTTVHSLFNYLEVPINQDRYLQWLPIYRKWQKIHTDRLMFIEYFDTIVDSIINNYYFDLSRCKLDILREAAIQHVLIYKHGLTIKGWGLEKFPSNTKELHGLLEPNVYHKVENIYQSL